MIFTQHQQNKLGDVYLDIGKGLILASFAAPVIYTSFTFLVVLRSFIAGIVIIYVGLLLSKENNDKGAQ